MIAQIAPDNFRGKRFELWRGSPQQEAWLVVQGRHPTDDNTTYKAGRTRYRDAREIWRLIWHLRSVAGGEQRATAEGKSDSEMHCDKPSEKKASRRHSAPTAMA